MATEKQKLARTRNWLKFQVMGMRIPQGPFTIKEQAKVKEINDRIVELQGMLDKGSEELGLKVNIRCWCKKIATTTSKDKETLGEPCCKNHEYLDL